MLRRAALFALLCLQLAGCAAVAEAPSFRHLDSIDGHIVTAHAIRVTVSSDDSLRAAPATHRLAIFDGHPFEVSMAALLGREQAVMVHAERVADSSGRSNYDSLPPAGWPDDRFRLRRQCAAIDREAVESEHDLAFLARQGWPPEGNLALEQYFAATPDHNQEVVISLIARVADCADAEANAAALRRLRDRVQVTAG
jgi:hypothetical protein